MNAVQGERLEIVAYDPFKRLVTKIAMVAGILLLVIAAFLLGRWSIWHERGTAVVERNELRQLTTEQNKELAELRRKVLVSESNSAVDKKAHQDIQQTVLNQNALIAKLENELHFYQRVIAPEKVDRGLRIDTFDLKPLEEDPRKVDFRLVVTQVTDNNTFIEGRALVSLIGTQGKTQEVTLPLKDVSPDINELAIRFRFKFFQNIVGQIQLPEDFEPEKVQVILQSTGNKAMRIQTEYNWPSKEIN